MQQRCTCGAILPEDARFCHKCGKPQFDEDIARLKAQEADIPAAAPPPAQRSLPDSSGISFKNSRAVLISVLVAGAAFLGSGAAALISPLLWPLVLMAAGFIAVVLYRSNSAEPLTTAAGARLGWMTGLCLFAVFAVVATVVSIYLASPAGSDIVKQLQSMPQFAKVSIGNPHDVMMNILVSAIPTFFMVTLLPGLGGMLGAKLSARGRHS
ncbi:MAG: zinc ribbon domain-containing protein [Acidobacteriaceae bacterium]|nr:zinc ribbon domain-containing protein [Acidobacteriaceae bacterium]MBV9296181.1 zinc ribbon domain-containing protein [Acidobacteriaceae bacterium]MBV9764893.1 zinc ribbon domain-containing protein [Acidobacteriaceae bacterium]